VIEAAFSRQAKDPRVGYFPFGLCTVAAGCLNGRILSDRQD
jgi:hypothetical protein